MCSFSSIIIIFEKKKNDKVKIIIMVAISDIIEHDAETTSSLLAQNVQV